MAYKINRKGEHVVMPDGMATVRDVQKFNMQRGTPEFYELEPAEVIKIFLDDSDLPTNADDSPNYSFYGAIEARMAMSSNSEDDIIIVKPLNTNIKEYPIEGEYVIVVDYFGDLYYTQKLNMHNSVNLNSQPGLSKIWDPFKLENYIPNDFMGDSRIRQVKAYIGDVTFNGRFGQSIKFGSNITEIAGKEGDTGKNISPNIIIKAGQGVVPPTLQQPVEEDINLDGSSVWITTDQTVSLNPASIESGGGQANTETLPKPYKWDGKQVIINSDRIVFNSKVNSIHAFSKTDISMAADSRINMESPIVNLGSRVATQPAICGTAMMKQFETLCKSLHIFSGQLSRLLPLMGNVGFPTPMMEIQAAGEMLKGQMKLLLDEDSLDFPKSKVVFVEKEE